jgi:cysteinyl-tRNA synthetase
MNEEEKALCREEEKVRDELAKGAINYKSQKEELYGKLSKIYNEAKDDATISTEQKKNKVKIFVLYKASEEEKKGLTDFLNDDKHKNEGIEFY